MTEFTMSAFAQYRDGSSGDAFAEVFGGTPVACFAAMAAEVARWLPNALQAGPDDAPTHVELTLQWSEEVATPDAFEGPRDPRDQGERATRPTKPHTPADHRRGQRCCRPRPLRGPARALPCASRARALQVRRSAAVT